MAGQPNASYIITRDGRQVGLDSGVPSLSDIAVSLSRMPRFAGNTSIPWTVLDHSLFMERLAARYAQAVMYDVHRSRASRLAALLHDAHEAITGDIPTAFKTDDMRDLQRRLDRRIMQEYYPGGVIAYEAFKEHVAAFDRRALLAEGMVVGPFSYADEEKMRLHFGDTPHDHDVAMLKTALDNGDVGPQAVRMFQPAAEYPTVQSFLRKYVELR